MLNRPGKYLSAGRCCFFVTCSYDHLIPVNGRKYSRKSDLPAKKCRGRENAIPLVIQRAAGGAHRVVRVWRPHSHQNPLRGATGAEQSKREVRQQYHNVGRIMPHKQVRKNQGWPLIALPLDKLENTGNNNIYSDKKERVFSENGSTFI